MTPAQYAQKLFWQFSEISHEMNDYSRIDTPTAKLHAIKCVDEIKKHCIKIDNGFWDLVKAEIEAI